MHARLRVMYTSTTFRILPEEADRDVGAGGKKFQNMISLLSGS